MDNRTPDLFDIASAVESDLVYLEELRSALQLYRDSTEDLMCTYLTEWCENLQVKNLVSDYQSRQAVLWLILDSFTRRLSNLRKTTNSVYKSASVEKKNKEGIKHA